MTRHAALIVVFLLVLAACRTSPILPPQLNGSELGAIDAPASSHVASAHSAR